MKIKFRDDPILGKVAAVEFDFWDKILLSIPRLRSWYAKHLGRKIEQTLRKKEAEEK